MSRGRPFAGLVAIALVVVGCGGPPSAQQVSSERTRPVVRPALPQISDIARQQSLPADQSPAVAPTSAADAGIGPRLPSAAPTHPWDAGPAVPGERPAATPAPAPAAATAPANVYGATISGVVNPALADIKPLVYVPNSLANTVSVIDPATLEVIDRFPVGVEPHHVTPSWDMTKLYVNNTQSNTLTVVDPRTGKPTGTIPVIDPYNLYFTIDGTKAIVVAERFERLDFRDPTTWNLIKSVPIPYSGADHMDFSADGKFLIVSTEFSGKAVKVDTEKMEVTGVAEVASLPVDVKVSPDGSVFFVANQGRHGVSVVDPEAMKEIAFIPTGRGAHGLYFSRDTKLMYVSNRLAGTISVIDVATRAVVDTWDVGGSPDMIQLNPEGTQLWVSGRYNASVLVVDTATGRLIKAIPTGAGAHGVSFFPAPGRFNVGHNGVYR